MCGHFKPFFSDLIKVKSFSMMNHVVNGWWGGGRRGEVGERGIKLHLETKALTSGT